MTAPLSADDAAAICRHMNDDHADAVAAYARSYGKIEAVRSAQMLDLDAAGMKLAVETDVERIVTRIDFDHAIVGKDEARETLIGMARHAMTDA